MQFLHHTQTPNYAFFTKRYTSLPITEGVMNTELRVHYFEDFETAFCGDGF
jgi:hypothetical protein